MMLTMMERKSITCFLVPWVSLTLNDDELAARRKFLIKGTQKRKLILNREQILCCNIKQNKSLKIEIDNRLCVGCVDKKKSI